MGLQISKDTVYENGAFRKAGPKKAEEKKAEAPKQAEPARKPVKKTVRKAADDGEKKPVDSLI